MTTLATCVLCVYDFDKGKGITSHVCDVPPGFVVTPTAWTEKLSHSIYTMMYEILHKDKGIQHHFPSSSFGLVIAPTEKSSYKKYTMIYEILHKDKGIQHHFPP